jgi:hypothetical protein
MASAKCLVKIQQTEVDVSSASVLTPGTELLKFLGINAKSLV